MVRGEHREDEKGEKREEEIRVRENMIGVHYTLSKNVLVWA